MWARSVADIMKAVLRKQSDHWLIAGISIEFVQNMSIMRMIDMNAEQTLMADRTVRKYSDSFKLELVKYLLTSIAFAIGLGNHLAAAMSQSTHGLESAKLCADSRPYVG